MTGSIAPVDLRPRVRDLDRSLSGHTDAFRLVRDHIAAGPVVALARSRDWMIEEMRKIADNQSVPPASVIVFGSFARGGADAESDIDTVLVRPSGVRESDEPWSETVQQWIDRVSKVSRNSVEVLEVPEDELPAKLDGGGGVWQGIKRDGLLVGGTPLDSLRSVVSG